MSIEVDTVTLPAYWACALINGDYSGMTDAEEASCHAAEERLAKDGWSVSDVVRDDDDEAQEPRFTWSYHLYDDGAFAAGVRGGEVLDYVVLRAKR